jgi:exopolyphosphatase/guanosine-5'-triphosphate,3'-diphosphate pyrophosphatase
MTVASSIMSEPVADVSSRVQPPSTATRLGAIDVGTNSIRLIVTEARPDGSYRLLDDEKEVGRLGRGFARTGRLSQKAMDSAAVVIARMKGIAEGYGVQQLRVVGTAAVREASNRAEFLMLLRDKAGVALEVISADEEARLAHLSVTHAFDLRRLAAAVVDIGGGSTEIVLSSGGIVEQVHTTPLGAVRLTEQFEGVADGAQRPFDDMREHMRRVLKERVSKPPFLPHLVIGTGGTFTTLAAVAMARGHTLQDDANDPADHDADAAIAGSVRGYELQRSVVNHILNWLRSMSPKARARLPGMSAERTEIIVAGVAIVDAVMQRLKANTLRVHDRGIRDGLILSMIHDIYPHAGAVAGKPPDRMESVRAFAERCNYEKAHSDHVAALALQAFDQIAAQLARTGQSIGGESVGAGGATARELLEAAGILHDVGYYINYEKHHKHSYHLIVHSDLPGFTHREIEIIASVARYHRRAGPKPKHSNFAKLSAADQQLVTRLSAILRIVDGLDRAHAQNVKKVRVELRKGTAWFIVDAAQEPAVDIWGAARKSALFLKVFGLEPRFDWSGSQPMLPAMAEHA